MVPITSSCSLDCIIFCARDWLLSRRFVEGRSASMNMTSTWRNKRKKSTRNKASTSESTTLPEELNLAILPDSTMTCWTWWRCCWTQASIPMDLRMWWGPCLVLMLTLSTPSTNFWVVWASIWSIFSKNPQLLSPSICSNVLSREDR